MAKNYVLSNGGTGSADYETTSSADITVGSLITHYLVPTWDSLNTTNNLVKDGLSRGAITLGSGEAINIAHVTPPAYPATTTWASSGTETVVIALETANADTDVRVRILQVNSSGTAQATGSWTSYQTMSVAVRTFNPTRPTWSSPAVTDRYVIEIEYLDTRPHGGSSTSFIAFTVDVGSNQCYVTAQTEGPDSGQYDGIYKFTNTASDLSTYANGNYLMDSTGETGSTTIEFTGVANAATRTIGFITASGDPNKTTWTNDTEEQVVIIECACWNDSSVSIADRAQYELTVERINSSGTVQESATASEIFCAESTTGTSGTYQQIGFSVPNRSWTSPASTDRIGLKLVITNNTGETSDFGIRIHDGTSQTGQFYSKTFPAGGTLFTESNTYTATGTAGLSTEATFFRTLANTATGTAALTKIGTFARTFANTAVGTAALTAAKTFTRAFSQTATGTAALVTSSVFTLASAISATGTAGFARVATFVRTLANSAVGSAALATTASFFRTLANTAVGTAALSTLATFPRAFSLAATGTAALATAAVLSVTNTFTGVGTAAIATQWTAVRNFAIAAAGAPALTTIATFYRTFNNSATGTSGFASTFIAIKNFSYSAVGTAGLVAALAFFKALAMTAVGTAALTTTFIKALNLSHTAVGIALISRALTLARTFGHTGIGTAAVDPDTTYVEGYGSSGVGSVGLTTTITRARSFAHGAVGTAALTTSFTPGSLAPVSITDDILENIT